MGDSSVSSGEERLRKTAFWLAVLAVVVAASIMGFTIFPVLYEFTTSRKILGEHLPAVVGVPAAASAAFVIVVFLRQTDGPIEFEGLGFKLKGAAGQILMWVICFLSIAGALKWLW